jgi:peptidyl-prolyl cis-trans isomerase SurA
MLRILTGLLLALTLSGLAHGQTRELATRGVLIDRVAAVVNDGVVLASELDEQSEMITARLQAQSLELPPQNVLRQQVLERLVVQEIQMQRAQRAGIRVPDEALNEALQDIAEQNGITLAQLPRALAAQGIDYGAYRDSMRKELTLNLLRQRDVYQRINVSPRELEQFLDRQRRMPAQGSEFDVSHILVAVPQAASAEQLEQAAARAAEVTQRARDGEDFGRLALAFSNAQSALEGGALGWRRGPELPTFLAEIVTRLKPGEVSEPLRTPTGYHIVRLNDTRGGDTQQLVVDQVHARHILMKPNELQDDATVRQKLAQLRDRILKGEEFGAVASVTSEDPGSAALGGDLGWTNPGTFVPEFDRALDALDENEISEPFRTQFGWHIVQLLGKRQADVTEDLRRQRALMALRESKADEETELWLRRLRDEAYVEYRM